MKNTKKSTSNTFQKHKKIIRRRRRQHLKERVRGGGSSPERRHRVDATLVSEFAIAFASYIKGDTGVLIILIVMADYVRFRSPLPFWLQAQECPSLPSATPLHLAASDCLLITKN